MQRHNLRAETNSLQRTQCKPLTPKKFWFEVCNIEKKMSFLYSKKRATHNINNFF